MPNKIQLKAIYILMFFYAIYDVLNSTSAGNSTDNRSSVYVFLFATIACLLFFCVSRYVLPRFGTLIYTILIAVYYVFDVFFIKGNISWSAIVYFGLSIWWVLTIWFFFSVVRKDVKIVNSIQNFVRIMFILYSLAMAYGAVNIVANYSVEYARIGYIYHILAMLPIVMLDRNEKVKNILLTVAVALTIFSFKRGAILILPFMLILYYFFNNNSKNKEKSIIKHLGMLVVFAVVWYVIDSYSGGYLSSRFTHAELADGSGRSDIWKTALENISMRNILQLLFGVPSSMEMSLWTGIHNEWISFLYSNGIIGLILLIMFVLTIVKQTVVLIKHRSRLAGAYAALTVYVLGVCMVSGFYHVHSTFYVMLFLGYSQGLLLHNNETISAAMGEEQK